MLSNISLSSCLYWYTTLNSCKYLKNETCLQNAQVNKPSSVSKGIIKTCLIVDYVRKKWSWIVAAGCELYFFTLARFSSFWVVADFSAAERIKICFLQLWKFTYHGTYSKETKQLYFQFTSYTNLSDMFHLYCQVWNNRTGTIIWLVLKSSPTMLIPDCAIISLIC